MPIAIIVHGGATTIPTEEEEAYRAGCLRAVEAGWAVLEQGGAALDAVEAAIRVLEDDPTFNAGRGGALNAAGEVELCAGVMEGEGLRFGAITVAQGVRRWRGGRASAPTRRTRPPSPPWAGAWAARAAASPSTARCRVGRGHNSSHMACAFRTTEMARPEVHTRKA